MFIILTVTKTHFIYHFILYISYNHCSEYLGEGIVKDYQNIQCVKISVHITDTSCVQTSENTNYNSI